MKEQNITLIENGDILSNSPVISLSNDSLFWGGKKNGRRWSNTVDTRDIHDLLLKAIAKKTKQNKTKKQLILVSG